MGRTPKNNRFIRTGTRIVKQQINYTAANILTDENLFAVVGDNYIPHGFGMGHIRGQTFVINQRFNTKQK